MVIIILEFFFFAFLGWIIDSLYSSIEKKKLTNSGFFSGPICPIYGIGGVVLVFFLKSFPSLIPPLLIFAATSIIIAVEYAGGVFCEKVLQIKLWDYSASRFNVGGYIDLTHSFFWLLSVIIFYYFIFPSVLVIENDINFLNFSRYWDLPIFIIFIFIFFWLTIRKVPARFLEVKAQVLDLSTSEYQHLSTDIRNFYRAKSDEVKKVLEEKIKKRLDKAGGTLKKRG